MGNRYRVEYDRDACIGIATCVTADSENWSMAEDNKADMKGGKQDQKTKFFIREIDESELLKWKEAAEACPVNVIHIIDLKTGEKVI